MVQRFYFQQGVGYLEGEGDRTEFQYDYNSVEPTSAQNVAGRLALTKSTFGGVGGGNTV